MVLAPLGSYNVEKTQHKEEARKCFANAVELDACARPEHSDHVLFLLSRRPCSGLESLASS